MKNSTLVVNDHLTWRKQGTGPMPHTETEVWQAVEQQAAQLAIATALINDLRRRIAEVGGKL